MVLQQVQSIQNTRKDIKIALAMIVKGDDQEAILLERCLASVSPFVDGIFVTITNLHGENTNSKCVEVANKYNAVVSNFEWVHDFSKARNFNFKQVPKDFDYIMWSDADDIWDGLSKLKPTISKYVAVDAFAFWYLYDFDETNNPTVVHKKTMIVKNDGCTIWEGKLHEDLMPLRSIDIRFIEGIRRIHLTNNDRVNIAKNRNIEISQQQLLLDNTDPRSYWNYANSLLADGRFNEAIPNFLDFIDKSDSDDERYIAFMRLAGCFKGIGENKKAIDTLFFSIGLRPEFPDAYFQVADYYLDNNNYDRAEMYSLLGLKIKPKYQSMIVYNPRDYDYNPMIRLIRIYFLKNRPDLAVPFIEACLKIYPDSKYLSNLLKDIKKESEVLVKAIKWAEKLSNISDKDKLIDELSKIPDDISSHPTICKIRNSVIVKTESTGKDLVYFCGMTDHEWNPDIYLSKGFGGSEEAVYYMSKEYAKLGFNVTVYNNCGAKPMIRDGVTYRPFWEFNSKDKVDYLILWRHPKVCDFEINASKIFVDLHDVIPEAEFNEKRLSKIDRIFVKSKAHRSLFPNIPDEKFSIIPNGSNIEDFKNRGIKKDPYLIINTSSPDRSMEVMPKLFKEIKKRVPQAKMKWAYGWGIFDQAFRDDIKKSEWKKNLIKEMEDAGIESLGKLNPEEVTKLYLEGSVMAYPTEFYEIDCISVRKAQVAGCIPVTTDFSALNESVVYGIKIHSEKDRFNWSKPYQFSYAIQNEEQQRKFVDAVVEQLLKPSFDKEEMSKWGDQFSWNLTARRWADIINK